MSELEVYALLASGSGQPQGRLRQRPHALTSVQAGEVRPAGGGGGGNGNPLAYAFKLRTQ